MNIEIGPEYVADRRDNIAEIVCAPRRPGFPAIYRDHDGYLQPMWPREVWRDHRVYFVQAGPGGAVKVGFTRNLDLRLRQLQTASPARLELVDAIVGTSAIEAEIHRRLSRYGCRVHGEWFDLGGHDGVRWIVLDLWEDGLVSS